MQAQGEQRVKTRAGVKAVCGLVSCCARPSRCTSKGDEDGRDAGSSCTMHPWVRDDCGHELTPL